MPLVSCPECQQKVSTQALACPQCAFPFPGKSIGSAGQLGTKLHACSDCGCAVSKQAKICPHCGVSLKGEQGPQLTNGNSVEETWLCTHCGTPYTRKVHKEEELVTDQQVVSTLREGGSLERSLSRIHSQEPTPHSSAKSSLERSLGPVHRHANGKDVSPSPRQRAHLWQDSSFPKEMDRYVATSRYPRSKKKSLIVGFIIFVFVAVSIVLGALWKFQGINPLEALVYWRM